MINSITIDFSTLNLWRTCPQKFAYRILHSINKPFESPALDFGKLVHLGIEHLNKLNATPVDGVYDEIDYLSSHNPPRLDATQPLLHVLNLVAIEAGKSELSRLLPDSRRSLKHLLLLLTAYHRRWYPDPLQTTQCEIKHKAYLGQTASGIHIFYSGTIDGLHGKKILERKTTSYLDTGFINRINPNAQATGYIFLAQDLLKDPTIDTCIFDAISTGGFGGSEFSANKRPASWLLYKDPDKLFLRAETYRTSEQLEEWRTRVLYDCDRIAKDIIRGTFSSNEPDACTAYNTTCPYIDLCRTASLSQRGALIANTMSTEIWDGFQINRDTVV